jgi:hypothetical protein
LAGTPRLRFSRAFPLQHALAAVVIVGWAICLSLYFDYARIEGLSVNVFTAGSGGDRLLRVRESLNEVEGYSLLQPYVELGLANAEALSRDRLQEKLVRNTRVLHFAPTREIAYRQAVLLALDGQVDAARTQLARSATYYPGFLPTFARVLKELEGTEPAAIGPLLRYSEERLNEPGYHTVRAN